MKIDAKSPKEYIGKLQQPRKSEIQQLHNLIRKTVPSLKPNMRFGMIGYGVYHYEYATGREGDWPVIALASRKNYISLYACVTDGKRYIAEKYKQRLPKASIGKSCVRFKGLGDVDLEVIRALLQETETAFRKSR